MKKLLTILAACAMSLSSMAQFASAPAFPGAEGFGRYVTGGRGGKIIHVTNLNDDGEGSLRAAVKQSGSRIIVFDVCGTIHLKSRLDINQASVTILGQTAPGQGIAIADYAVYIKANNVIMRYIRCRMGDVKLVEDDALSCSNHDSSIRNNIIVDHCSVSWSTDECASFYGNRFFTLQWCYITESLRNSVHDKGKHGYGGIWGGENASFHHNLLAHHDSRNARLDHDYVSTLKGPIDYVNNAIYNWGGNNTYGGESVKGTGFRKVNFVGNYFKPGPASTGAKSQLMNVTSYCTNCNKSDGAAIEPAHLYLKDNVITSSSTVTNDNWKGIIPDNANKVDVATLKSDTKFTSTDTRFNYNTISIHPAAVAFEKILATGGCSLHRDIIDKRISNEAKNGTYTYKGSNGSDGGLIDTQGDVGAWCSLNTYPGLTDTDGDGMPDIWETANGLNPKANDANLYTLDPREYYTNIEVYANSLVEENVKAEREGTTETFEEYYPTCKRIDYVTKEEVYAEGTITWPLNSPDQCDGGDIVNGIISPSLSSYLYDEASVTTGSILKPQSAVLLDKDGLNLLKITNGTSEGGADGSKESAVNFRIETDPSDYFFSPTALEFYAAKDGSDTKMSLVAKSNDDVLVSVDDLPRLTKSNAAINSAYHYNASVSATPASVLTLSMVFNGGGAGKSCALSGVVLSGKVVKTVSRWEVVGDPAGIETITAPRQTALRNGFYNLQGQRVPSTTRGILIHNGRKMVVR